MRIPIFYGILDVHSLGIFSLSGFSRFLDFCFLDCFVLDFYVFQILDSFVLDFYVVP